MAGRIIRSVLADLQSYHLNIFMNPSEGCGHGNMGQTLRNRIDDTLNEHVTSSL